MDSHNKPHETAFVLDEPIKRVVVLMILSDLMSNIQLLRAKMNGLLEPTQNAPRTAL